MSLKKELGELKPGKSIIVITSEIKYPKVASEILNYLTKEQKLSGIYVSVSKPYEKVKSELSSVNWDKILFLDGISKSLGKKSPEKNCIYLQGPTSLTEIGIHITEATLKSKVNFLIVDSLSSLLIYNNEKIVLRFAQYITAKSKSLEMVGIVTANEKDEEKAVISAVQSFADKIIRV